MADQRRHKYREIFDYLHEGILRGRYRPGSRIPTEMELAVRFDSSRMTVSRALRELQTQGLLLRRPGAGTFVQDQQRQATGTVGLIFPFFPGVHSSMFDAMLIELTRQIQTAGYGLFLGDPLYGGVDVALQDPEKVCAPYLARNLVCVFFTPVELPPDQMSANVRMIELFDRERIPVVLVDRDICDFPSRSQYDLIGVDNFGAAYTLTQHLLSVGHRRIHFVGTSAVAATVSARIMGYQAALIQHGIMPDPSWVHRGDPRLLEFARELRGHSPDALVCSNDHVAAMVLRHFATLGVRVPTDVAVVGFDDTPFASLLAPPLTTIRQPATALGAAAVHAMTERLKNRGLPPREIRLPCELVIRESCGALRAAPGETPSRADDTPRRSTTRGSTPSSVPGNGAARKKKGT